MTTPIPSDADQDVEPAEPAASPLRFATEAAIGIAMAFALCLALLASTGEIPFVYQGY